MDLRRVTAPHEIMVKMAGSAVCAGFPSPADDFVENLDLSSLLIANPPATFLWRVEGVSMIDEGIFPNDLVLVDRSLTPRNGDVAIVVVDGERSLKKIHLRGGRLRLEFGNRKMRPFELREGSHVEVWGVVAWTLRPLRPGGAR